MIPLKAFFFFFFFALILFIALRSMTLRMNPFPSGRLTYCTLPCKAEVEADETWVAVTLTVSGTGGDLATEALFIALLGVMETVTWCLSMLRIRASCSLRAAIASSCSSPGSTSSTSLVFGSTSGSTSSNSSSSRTASSSSSSISPSSCSSATIRTFVWGLCG